MSTLLYDPQELVRLKKSVDDQKKRSIQSEQQIGEKAVITRIIVISTAVVLILILFKSLNH